MCRVKSSEADWIDLLELQAHESYGFQPCYDLVSLTNHAAHKLYILKLQIC